MKEEEQKPTLQELVERMGRMYAAAIAQQERMESFYNDVRNVIVTCALKHYPGIYDLDAEGFRKFDTVLWRDIDRLVEDVERVMHEAKV